MLVPLALQFDRQGTNAPGPGIGSGGGAAPDAGSPAASSDALRSRRSRAPQAAADAHLYRSQPARIDDEPDAAPAHRRRSGRAASADEHSAPRSGWPQSFSNTLPAWQRTLSARTIPLRRGAVRPVGLGSGPFPMSLAPLVFHEYAIGEFSIVSSTQLTTLPRGGNDSLQSMLAPTARLDADPVALLPVSQPLAPTRVGNATGGAANNPVAAVPVADRNAPASGVSSAPAADEPVALVPFGPVAPQAAGATSNPHAGVAAGQTQAAESPTFGGTLTPENSPSVDQGAAEPVFAAAPINPPSDAPAGSASGAVTPSHSHNPTSNATSDLLAGTHSHTNHANDTVDAPEPGTLALVAVGGLAVVRRRRSTRM
ncbi:MAG TPA: PEP-CTERM sorting domain-containing protein [Phycisphaerae bacterium]|nr:PEP-CTERM sorting domain-containing protein [Phycisphaerales bacterium]HRX85427.1 PEP-CTERM sorting domain-containing protein [Phycisphaerae bacterium]